MLNSNWESKHCWIAYFDILGFKHSLEKDFPFQLLQSKLDDLIEWMEQKFSQELLVDRVKWLLYQDTFIIYTDAKIEHYPAFLHISTYFFQHALSLQIPFRGAISYGEVWFGYDNRMLVGKAFLAAHELAENQNWLGLLLSLTAIEELRKHGLNALNHGFINCCIPQKKNVEPKDGYVYNFNHSIVNGRCAMLSSIYQMWWWAHLSGAPDTAKEKYEHTMNYILELYPKSTLNPAGPSTFVPSGKTYSKK